MNRLRCVQRFSVVSLLLVSFGSSAKADGGQAEHIVEGHVVEKQPLHGMDIVAHEKPPKDMGEHGHAGEGGSNGQPGAPTAPAGPPPPPPYTVRSDAVIDPQGKPYIDAWETDYFRDRHKTADVTSGKRTVEHTVDMILHDLDAATNEDGVTSYRSLDAYRNRTIVDGIQRAYDKLGQPDPTAGLVALQRPQLRQQLINLVQNEADQGRPFSNHLNPQTFDVSVVGMSHDDKAVAVNDALSRGATVIIEGPESDRANGIAIKLASIDPSRVRYRATKQSHLHFDFTGAPPIQPWLPLQFTARVSDANTTRTLSVQQKERDDGSAFWTVTGSGKGKLRCDSSPTGTGYQLNCENGDGVGSTITLPDFSSDTDARWTYRDSDGSSVTLAGQITSVLDAPFDLDE